MFRNFVPALALVLLAFTACSDDDTSTPAPGNTDAGTGGQDSGAGATDSGGPTSKAINGCNSYTDGTTIAWSITSAPPSTCLRVTKGGKVTFNGDLTSHPIAASGGDGAGTPFATVSDTGTSKEFTFDTVGTFGFVCTNHPSMTGAIEVVP
jgi:hypothetical protein